MRQLSKKEVGAVLAGYALPAELLCGESLASYFSRLYMEANKELAKRDAQVAELAAENLDLKQYVVDELKYLSPTTPATDAAANALRAEGVEMYGNLTIEIGKEEDDSDIIYAGKQALLYANQLREGK